MSGTFFLTGVYEKQRCQEPNRDLVPDTFYLLWKRSVIRNSKKVTFNGPLNDRKDASSFGVDCGSSDSHVDN